MANRMTDHKHEPDPTTLPPAQHPPTEPPTVTSRTPFDPPRVIDSETILAGQREVWIRHQQLMYRLRKTSSGKLYLTK
ncbi:hemin uptake protein HemP [Roseiconus lacunae]